MSGAYWQAPEIDELKSLWGTMSATAIGLQMGMTKGQIIGKADRLGLACLKLSGRQANMPPRPWRSNRNPHTKQSKKRRAGRPQMEDLSLEQMKLITIVELDSDVCHWPVGDPMEESFRYCGLPSKPWEGPYCSHHLDRSMASFEKVFACTP